MNLKSFSIPFQTPTCVFPLVPSEKLAKVESAVRSEYGKLVAIDRNERAGSVKPIKKSDSVRSSRTITEKLEGEVYTSPLAFMRFCQQAEKLVEEWPSLEISKLPKSLQAWIDGLTV